MFLVDITLYTGQHLQCEDEPVVSIACSMAKNFCYRTMVEQAIVIDMKTGEIVYDVQTPAAQWRIG